MPLLLVYFSFGSQQLIMVALTFWEKNALQLTAAQLLSISVWITFPWTIKVLVGQLVDVLPLFGSNRKVWIYLGSVVLASGCFCLWYTNISLENLVSNETYSYYLAAYLLLSTGYMIQDTAADAMSAEVVDRNASVKDQKIEHTRVQLLARLSILLAWTCTAGLGAYLSKNLNYETIFLTSFILPLISITGAIFIKTNTIHTRKEFDLKLLWLGIALVTISLTVAIFSPPYSQELIFILSLILTSLMLKQLTLHLPTNKISEVALGYGALFIFFSMPELGPAYNWWLIDHFYFDEQFLGQMKQIGGISAILTIWLCANMITERPIKTVLLILILVKGIMWLPNFALFYELHTKVGIDPKILALFDSAIDTPASHIAHIPLLVLIAYMAPSSVRATWFAVSASFINLALTAKHLFTKYLNQIFVITPNSNIGDLESNANYNSIEPLIWSVAIISFSVPLIALGYWYKRGK